MECCESVKLFGPVTTLDGTRFGIAVLELPMGPGIDHYCDFLLGENSFRYACRSVEEAWELAGERPWLKIRGDEPDRQVGGMLRDAATAWCRQATMQADAPRDLATEPLREDSKARRLWREACDFLGTVMILFIMYCLVALVAASLQGDSPWVW